MSRDLHDFQCLFFPSFCEASPDIYSHNNVYLEACLSCSSDIDMIIIMFTYIFVLAIFFHSHTAERVRLFLACDHALSLYLCNLFSGRGHDTFLSQITCKKARIWTFFWLDRKQYGWFALFRLAKTPPSVSCCWFQSAFLLAYKWAVNTYASSLWTFCRLSFHEFEECLNRNFIHWNIFHFIVY